MGSCLQIILFFLRTFLSGKLWSVQSKNRRFWNRRCSGTIINSLIILFGIWFNKRFGFEHLQSLRWLRTLNFICQIWNYSFFEITALIVLFIWAFSIWKLFDSNDFRRIHLTHIILIFFFHSFIILFILF